MANDNPVRDNVVEENLKFAGGGNTLIINTINALQCYCLLLYFTKFNYINYFSVNF